MSYAVWWMLHRRFDNLKIENRWNIERDFTETVKLFPILTGIVERLFFTVLVAFQVSGVGGGLIAWAALKLAAGWGATREGRTPHRALAFTGLIPSLISLLFAVLGGLICNGTIPLCSQWGGRVSNAENVYWAFSSAAQAVATFIAFILAGYALVHSMMETALQADETLQEIHDALRRRYHFWLSGLVVTTAASVTSCLSVVFLNGAQFRWLPFLEVVTSVLVLASIVGGVLFVIMIVDPRKYRRTAARLASDLRPKTRATASRAEFIESFIQLEQRVGQLWLARAGERLSRRRGPPSFREMLEALILSEVFSSELYQRLLEIGRHRNLVFHGEVSEVDPRIVEEVKRALDALAEIPEDA